MESRFLPKLENYLQQDLIESQVGFVPDMGVNVNLVRAIKRIRMGMDEKKRCYGLFIDLKSA